MITGDNGRLDAERVLEQPGKIMSRGAGAGAAAFGRILGVAQIVDRFKRRVGAYEMDDVIFLRRADPGKFAPIEFDFRAADELFEVEPRD